MLRRRLCSLKDQARNNGRPSSLELLSPELDGGETDQLLFDQYEREWMDDPELAAQARENTKENFGLVFQRRFIATIVQRMDSNEEIFKRVLDDEDFRAALADFYLARVYGRLRDTGS